MRDIVRRAGQRLAIGFAGHAASADVRALLREFGVGTVVLSGRNVEAPEQVAELVRELQELVRDCGHEQPLLVAVEQEGGRATELCAPPWTPWPPARALGRLGSDQLARRMGAAIADELLSCGIRADLAPVVDVDTNPDNPVIGDRSFGGDPEAVGRLGAAFVEGLQQNGVAACAKHFPGYGDTALDPRQELPAVDHSRARLDDVELRPFRRAIDARVAMVMTAHLLVRELDDARPATLSPALVDGVLRDEMGFAGVTVTDDLELKAIAERWRPGPAAVAAARAGCDLLCFGRDHGAQVEGVEALVRALESGEIPFKQAEAAEKRIRALKNRFLSGYRDPDPRQARLAAGRLEHLALAEEIGARAGLVV